MASLPLVLAAHRAVRLLAAAGLPPLALERVEDAVGAEALLLLRLAAHAAALLRELGRVLMRVVRLLANDGALLHHHLVHAAAAAVVPAGGGHPRAALLGVHRRRGIPFLLLHLGRRSAAERRERCCGCRNGQASLHELAAAPRRRRRTNVMRIHAFPPLIFVSRRLVAPPPPSSTSPTDARVHSIPPILGASYSTARGAPDARALTPPRVRPPAARACSRLPGDIPRARRFAGSAVWTGRPRSCS